MKVYGLWWGGHSYSTGSIEDGDLEIFSSVDHAKRVLMERYNSNGIDRCAVKYADGREEKTLFPAVTQDSAIYLYMADPRGDSDPYPDRRVYLHLVVTVENC